MQQLIEFVIVLAGVIFAWRKVAAWRGGRGHGAFASHVAGAAAGAVVFMLLMGVVVSVDPPPAGPEQPAAQAATAPQPAPEKAAAKAERPAVAPKAEPGPDATGIKVSAGKLFSDYQDNEVAADNLYKGKKLQVTGAVQSVDKDVFNNIIVNFRSPNEFMPVAARVDDAMAARAAALKRGQKIIATCEGAGVLAKVPQLDGCVF